jgi:Uma2 family endonuclease
VVRADDTPLVGPHPRTALLVIEVAGDSLRLDRQSKATLYAGAGIPEYWIVNLGESAIEVQREPDPATGVYRSRTLVVSGEFTAARVAALTIDVVSLFR